MANGPKKKRLGEPSRGDLRGLVGAQMAKRERGRLRSGSPSSYLKKILGMTQRPTQAGQARFGDVDVMGAQMTPIEEARQTAMGIKNPGVIGKAIQRQLGAQMTPDEIRRANRQTPIDRYGRGARR